MPTNVEIPPLGESVREAVLVKWHKNDGETVAADEPLCELETEKANVDIPSPAAGVLRRVKDEGDTVQVGETIARIDEGAGAAKLAPAQAGNSDDKTTSASATATSARPEDMRPSVRRIVEEQKLKPESITASGPHGKMTKEDALRAVSAKAPIEQDEAETEADEVAIDLHSGSATPVATRPLASAGLQGEDGVKRVPMSKIRRRIAERLVQAQQTAAILTTYNEADLSAIQELRSRFKERFQEIHGVSLGLMSFFCRAAVLALKEFPRLNAFIEGDDIVYHNHVHLGIAVSTERGLVVPVLKNVESMSFAKIESEIKRLANATRDGKLGLHELSGGTFTITNGGVFGSLFSTPILNPPQSGILGMHTIQKRPVVVNDKIEIRPMMYLALSYDHRLVDGRESVSFLVRVKQFLEDPSRLMLEI